MQRINLLQWPILLWLGGMTTIIATLVTYFRSLSQAAVESQSALIAALVIFSVIISFLILGAIRKINVYEEFVEGAKEGFGVAVKIIPFLVAILVAIGVFRASGSFEAWVDALPTAIMKPLSGSGARGLAAETMDTFGVDSFAGRLACTFQGSTETTFYVLAVYFGSVGIRKTRYAIVAGLSADLAGIIAAILIAYATFG